MRHLLPLLLCALVAAAALTFASSASAATHSVQISRSAFTPQTVTVAPGDTVVWTNADDASFTSPVLHPGQTYSATFTSSGTTSYHDGYYPHHTGRVVVSGGAPQVLIKAGGFQPQTETIDAGQTVVWKNVDTQDHQVIADDGSFSSPVLHQGQT
ncbi:MAG: hypothetical protein ACRDPA_01645, partial [Solirubrobacteraceae bacterium]